MHQLARRIPEDSRAAAVRALGKVVRSYCESAAFKKEFLERVKEKYPYDDRYSDASIASQEQAVGQMDGMVSQQLGMMLAGVRADRSGHVATGYPDTASATGAGTDLA